MVFRALYLPELASLLPRVLTEAAAGNYQGLLALAFSSPPEGDKRDLAIGMHLSVVCAEDIPRITAADRVAADAGGFLGAAMFDAQYAACAFWPRGEVPDGYYAPVSSERPVLILSGADDPITPPAWGDHVAPHLPNSQARRRAGRRSHHPHARLRADDRRGVPAARRAFEGLDASCAGTLTRPPFFVSPTGPAPPSRVAPAASPAPSTP